MSDLFRANASKDVAVDLVSVLDAARIMAQSLLPNIDVEFAGMKAANTDHKRISLSTAVLGTEHPVDGDKVDIFLGDAVHKMGEALFLPDFSDFYSQMKQMLNVYAVADRQLLDKVIRVYQDIYVDAIMSGFPVYKEYLQRERKYVLGNINANSITTVLKGECDKTDILNALVYFTLMGGSPSVNDIDQKNLAVLSEMLSAASDMTTGKQNKATCIARAWNKLRELQGDVDHSNDQKFKQPPQPSNDQPDDDQQSGSDSDAGDDTNDSDTPDDDTKQDDDTNDSDDMKDDDSADNGDDTPDDDDNDKDGNSDDDKEKDQSKPDKTDSDSGDKPQGVDKSSPDDGADSKTGAAKDNRPEYADQDLANMLDSLSNDDTPLDDDTANKVSDAIIEKRDDLTQLISQLAKDSTNTIVAYTPPENGQNAANARMHTAVAEEQIRHILQQYRLRQTRDYHGLREGRISTRRLARLGFGDTRIFKRREQPDEIDMILCLCFDMSGSTRGNFDLIAQLVCAMSDALKKEKVEFIAIGYSLNGGIVSIPRLYDKETSKVMLELTKEWGFTPSYEGLATAIAQLMRLGGTKRKVLIHFTDGKPNSGNTDKIPELLADARQHGITDIHICIPGTDSDSTSFQFENMYGANTQILDDINKLPEHIREEFEKNLNK